MKRFSTVIAKLLAAALTAFMSVCAPAQTLTQGGYHWYVPEHEIYGRTTFYSQPTFQSAMVRVIRTQRFRLVGSAKGWAQIQFDVAGKAYVHLRILRNMAYDPGASDPLHEFQRASVFAEEPAKFEARLKAPAATTAPSSGVGDPKTPIWKRYKDGWALKPGRPAPAGGPDDAAAETAQSTTRPPAGTAAAKSRNKYSLLPPIGSEPPKEADAAAAQNESDTPPAR